MGGQKDGHSNPAPTSPLIPRLLFPSAHKILAPGCRKGICNLKRTPDIHPTLLGFRISVSGTALCPGAPAINLRITQSSPSPAFRSIGTATLNLPSLLQILCELYLGYISQEQGFLVVGPTHVGFTSHCRICFPSGNFHVSTSPGCRIVRLFNLGVSVKLYLIGAFNIPYLDCYKRLCTFSCIYGPLMLPFL